MNSGACAKILARGHVSRPRPIVVARQRTARRARATGRIIRVDQQHDPVGRRLADTHQGRSRTARRRLGRGRTAGPVWQRIEAACCRHGAGDLRAERGGLDVSRRLDNSACAAGVSHTRHRPYDLRRVHPRARTRLRRRLCCIPAVQRIPRGAVARRRDRIAVVSPHDVLRVGKPRPAILEHRRRTATLPEAPTEPVELRIALAIASGEDADAAAALATKAMPK